VGSVLPDRSRAVPARARHHHDRLLRANFPNCTRTSIYEASERDFRIVLATDAISRLYDRASKELANIGVHLMNSSELLAGDGPQTAGRT
jgi:hypothetical protein